MKERSVAKVKARLEVQRRERDRIIARQSFYCTRRKRLMAPAGCHDCFAKLPYLERLTRWNENRMQCVKAHRASHLQKEKGERDVSSPLMGEDKGGGEKPFPPVLESYSIDEYMSRGLLEFLLDLDVLAQRFETWRVSLADAARMRVHRSAEVQEMILWFAERLQGFQKTVLLMGRRPEEASKEQNKEEKCGVKN